jgi:hypothetical protein
MVFTYNKPHRCDQPTESISGYVSVKTSNLESDYKTKSIAVAVFNTNTS